MSALHAFRQVRVHFRVIFQFLTRLKIITVFQNALAAKKGGVVGMVVTENQSNRKKG